MSRSVKFLGNHLVRRAAGWAAGFLAVVSVSLLGRSGEAAASPIVSLDNEALKVGHNDSDIQISYLQIGTGTGADGDWWPPLPE